MPESSAVSSAHLRQPRQSRSEETLRRLLAAAEEALRERSWTETTLAEIARRAGVTIGAIYARFADKAALLRHLEESSYRGLGDQLRHALRPLATDEAFEDRLAALFGTLADYYASHRGVARALSEISRSEPDLLRRRKERNRPLFDLGRAWILASHPGAARAGAERVNTALLFATTALRERLLFRDFWPGSGLPPTRELCRELAAATAAYLAGSAASR